MKLLAVTPVYPPEIGGPATYLVELKKRLTKKTQISVTGFGSALIPTSGGAIIRQFRLFASCIVEGIGKDLFYLQDPLVVGFVGFLVGKLLRKKVLVKYVGDPNWEKLRSQGSLLPLPEFLVQSRPNTQSRLTGFVLSHADTIIVPATHLKHLLIAGYHVSPEKIVIIPNSVARPNLKTKKNTGQVVFVGRLVKWKNVDLVVQAISEIAETTTIVLHIIGDGPEEQTLKKLVTKLKLEKQVVFLGRLTHSEVLQKLAQSELLILYSDYEGLPHVALEAMSVGTIPVLSDISGNDEIKGAVLVPSHNPKALALEIQSMLKDRNHMKSLSELTRMEVRQTYSWEKNINELEKIFNRLCPDYCC